MLMFVSDVFVHAWLDRESATWFPASFIRASTSGIRAALSWMMPSMPWKPIGTTTPLRTPLACLMPVCPRGRGEGPGEARGGGGRRRPPRDGHDDRRQAAGHHLSRGERGRQPPVELVDLDDARRHGRVAGDGLQLVLLRLCCSGENSAEQGHCRYPPWASAVCADARPNSTSPSKAVETTWNVKKPSVETASAPSAGPHAGDCHARQWSRSQAPRTATPRTPVS